MHRTCSWKTGSPSLLRSSCERRCARVDRNAFEEACSGSRAWRIRRSATLAARSMGTMIEKFRKDYEPPAYTADSVSLCFDLSGERCRAESSVMYRRHRVAGRNEDLVLNGRARPANMVLESVSVNGLPVDPVLSGEDLRIQAESLPHEVNRVDIAVTLDPASNLSLSGLYKSSGNFCTQCEAEGFRNMMYFVDRPDNMSKFTTKIVADKASCPVLLSNGNNIDQGELADGKHFATWEDPWPKPSYLFALVAGSLKAVRDTFLTRDGKQVALNIFVEDGNEHKAGYAMEALKRAFKWDEERFDRIYDLEQFNIVAVSDFNMGAMENKSLNIFNSKYVLANKETATDSDFHGIERVIAHEYFHNWSGNRVTCRDWFQLTLKEGLTVFRDQEFSSDMHSRTAERIRNVSTLRQLQFPEDSGPMAHPIRPESYVAMDNFYTSTVYEKGAEVVRMIFAMVGREGFRAGLNHYFHKYDSCAVTCDDFVSAMEEGNPGTSLEQFRNSWYSQAGTPHVYVNHEYDAASRTFVMKVRQSCANARMPHDIPFAIGLIGRESRKEIPVKLAHGEAGKPTALLRVSREVQTFVLHDVPESPVPSYLRGFSAPVILHCGDLSIEDYAFLAKHDTDTFNRYDAGQELAKAVLFASAQRVASQRGIHCDEHSLLFETMRQVLDRARSSDRDVCAMSLRMPTETILSGLFGLGHADAAALSSTCAYFDAQMGQILEEELLRTYQELGREKEESQENQTGSRALRNQCLYYLLQRLPGSGGRSCEYYQDLALEQFKTATNMTDKFGALLALNDQQCEQREAALGSFLGRFKGDRLVVQKWLALVASTRIPGRALQQVREICSGAHSDVFNIENPNDCRALLGSFAGNFRVFHNSPSGEAYSFFAERVLEIDSFNPQLASKLAKNFTNFRNFTHAREIREHVEAIASAPNISADLNEVVCRSLKSSKL